MPNLTQLQGLVIPTNWDEQGKILDVAIAAFDEDQIFVESNEDSEQLFNLIGQHVMAAPIVKMLELEAIPMGYMLIESGKVTSAEFMSNTKPIPKDKLDIAVAHALAAEYLGMKLIYLEAGSGAQHPVPDEMIQAVARMCSLPIIVGGGIRTPDVAKQKVAAGATFIVTGNVLEKNNEKGTIQSFAQAIHKL